MKKKIISFVLLSILFVVSIIGGNKLYKYIRIKTAKIEIVLKDDMKVEFNDEKKISDYIESINGRIVDDYTLDTSTIGVKTIDFEFINDDGIKLKYSYEIEVVDTVAPLIWLNSSYRLKKGTDFNIDGILCGDNYDENPTCYVEGDYDINTLGEYPLTFKAIDKSGNESMQDFILKVYEPSNTSSNKSSNNSYIKFSDVIKDYKTSNIKIGIDVSSWQGDIDFKKIKEAGVEFIIIRVGGTKGTDGQYFLDSKFKQNISQANKYNIPVGIYFYSYANSNEHAIRDAKWLKEQIKDYKIDLPIAFDWEEWSSFNQYNLSFFDLTNIAESFLDELELDGYSGMLYSSKLYLEYIWLPTKYDIWLAHYVPETNYKGKYKFWQMCSDGRIDGIKGDVDIDIMYY